MRKAAPLWSIALVLFALALLCFEFADSRSKTMLFAHELDELIDVDDAALHRSRFAEHWCAVLLAESLLSSVGAVVAERKYKTLSLNLSFFAQSSSMYLWSLVVASLMFYVANVKEASKELLLLNLIYGLKGFNVWTWALVVIHVAAGFAGNYVVKYFDNVTRLLGLAVSVCLAHVLVSWQVSGTAFGEHVGVLSAMAYVLTGLAIWLYLNQRCPLC